MYPNIINISVNISVNISINISVNISVLRWAKHREHLPEWPRLWLAIQLDHPEISTKTAWQPAPRYVCLFPPWLVPGHLRSVKCGKEVYNHPDFSPLYVTISGYHLPMGLWVGAWLSGPQGRCRKRAKSSNCCSTSFCKSIIVDHSCAKERLFYAFY